MAHYKNQYDMFMKRAQNNKKDGDYYYAKAMNAKNEEEKKKVQLILDELFPGENVDVPDPYNGIQSNFDQVFEMLDEACDSIANKLLEKK